MRLEMLTVLISSSSKSGLAKTTSETLFELSSRELFNKAVYSDEQNLGDERFAISAASFSHTRNLVVPCGAFSATSVRFKMSCGSNTQEDWKSTNLIVYVLDLADRTCVDSLKKCHSHFIAQAFRTKTPANLTKLYVYGVAPKYGEAAVKESDVSAWCTRKSDVWTVSYIDSSTKIERLVDKVVATITAAAQAPPVPPLPAPQTQSPDDSIQKIKERRRQAFERAMFTAIEADRQSETCEAISSSRSVSGTSDLDMAETAANPSLMHIDAMSIIENSLAMHRSEREALSLMEYDLDDDEPVSAAVPTSSPLEAAAAPDETVAPERSPLSRTRMKSRSWSDQRKLPLLRTDLGGLPKAHSVSLPASPSHARSGARSAPQSPPDISEPKAPSPIASFSDGLWTGFGLLANRSKTSSPSVSSPSSPSSLTAPTAGSRSGSSDFYFPRWFAFPR